MAAASIMTAAGLTAFFKTRFPDREVQNLVCYDKPLLSALSKKDDLEGVETLIPFQLDTPQGMSAALVTALTNVTTSVAKRWVITPGSYYGGLTIDAKSMMASRSNQGAWIRLREREYAGQLESMGQEFEKQLWGDGTGSMGTLDADPGTGTDWSLTRAEDSINLHLGMRFLVYANSSGFPGTVRAGGPYIVATINEDTGDFTTTAAANAAIASGDHLVREGDVDLTVKGVQAWVPVATPGATAFFGLDRTVAPQKMAGWRGTWKGTIEETAKALDAKIRRKKQAATTLWLSYSNFNRLDLELGARGMREADSTSGNFGRNTLKMTSPGGGLTIRTGPYVPEHGGYMLDMSTWAIHTLGALPHLVQDDGMTAVRIGGGVAASAVDGIEIRLRAFWQLVCDNPYANGYFPIS
jgi:hypothetical protein